MNPKIVYWNLEHTKIKIRKEFYFSEKIGQGSDYDLSVSLSLFPSKLGLTHEC